MDSSKISNVFMAGGGFMGSAIAFLVATKTKAAVSLFDISPEALKKAEAGIDKMGKSSVDKGFLTQEELADARQRITTGCDLKAAATANLVIEAIAENLEAKQNLFRELDGICDKQAVFASNTSSLPITSIASATKRTDKFLGMHFFSPAHIMKLLEIIPGVDTADDTIAGAKSFGAQLGKTVITSKDMPGFITTRLGMVLLNEAAHALMEGLSTAQEIDLGMTLGYNHPMGPLALADFVGLDIVLHIMKTMHEGFGDPKYAPCPLIRQLVSAGHLGRKTGRGFYQYGNQG
jgi:3-hydroxybutyryl-CoA dehydrogenase